MVGNHEDRFSRITTHMYNRTCMFQVNIKLVKVLVEAGGSVTSHKSDEGKTILHMMAEQCMETDLSEILRILVEQVNYVYRVVSQKCCKVANFVI